MKRIFKKKLEKEIQKVASFSEDKQHCLDIIYDHNRKEQDFFLEQMNLFNIKDKDLRLYGHFSFSVKAEKGNREQRIAIPHPHRNALCFEGEKPAKLHPFLSKLRQARIDKTVYNPYGTLAHRASQWRPRRTLHQPIPPL